MMPDSDNIDGVQDECNSNIDGSNSIISPEKKKSKKDGGSKGSKKRKIKQAPAISRSMMRKLKKLQEEKEEKLLQIKIIEILEKQTIWDGAYSLLQSSGTIGQAETVKDKRRRAVQLSKAGLEVPEDLSPLKRKRKRNASCDEELVLNHDAGQSYLQNASTDNDKIMVKCMESDDCSHDQPARVHLESISQISDDVDVRSNEVTPSLACIRKDTDTCVSKVQNDAPFSSRRSDKGNNTKVQDKRVCDSNVKNMTINLKSKVHEHLSAPIVVHVSRPTEVEQKRKDLPIIMMGQEIMEAINEHSIVILCGETGCGKTTQVPQFAHAAVLI